MHTVLNLDSCGFQNVHVLISPDIERVMIRTDMAELQAHAIVFDAWLHRCRGRAAAAALDVRVHVAELPPDLYLECDHACPCVHSPMSPALHLHPLARHRFEVKSKTRRDPQMPLQTLERLRESMKPMCIVLKGCSVLRAHLDWCTAVERCKSSDLAYTIEKIEGEIRRQSPLSDDVLTKIFQMATPFYFPRLSRYKEQEPMTCAQRTKLPAPETTRRRMAS
jgi:hypothetical protein